MTVVVVRSVVCAPTPKAPFLSKSRAEGVGWGGGLSDVFPTVVPTQYNGSPSPGEEESQRGNVSVPVSLKSPFLPIWYQYKRNSYNYHWLIFELVKF